MRRLRGRPRHPDVLTPREWEVASLLRRGLSNREIGGRLGISHAGAKYHVAEILGKLGVPSRLDAAALLSAGEGAITPGFVWRREEPMCDNRGVDDRPIGFFDSGVGGLTIWRATKKLLPNESLIFLADSGHVPYGEKSTAELRDLTVRICRFLLSKDAKMIVVACNTATVHSISYLRETFPDVPFVGVVPVVKTLARQTRTGTIAVLSTPATAASPYLAGLVEEFAPDKHVINIGCDGLEDLVEEGRVRTRAATALLERHLAPIRGSEADVLGLGCTHYPFLRQRIKRILGPGVRVYDPSRPVARRVRQLLSQRDAFAGDGAPTYEFYTTGDPAVFKRVATTLLRFPVTDAGYVDLEEWG
ncbi:MAG: glutamate racemase [Dehalococcoidia bacterium]